MLTLQKARVFNRPSDHVCVQYWLPAQSYPEHDHDYNEILFLLAGEMTHIVNGRPWFMRPGSFISLRADDRHAFENMRDICAINLLHLPLEQLNWFRGSIAPLFQEPEPQVWHMSFSCWAKVVEAIDDFASDAIAGGEENPLLRSAQQETFLMTLVSSLQHYRQQTSVGLSIDERVCLALSWVEQHWQAKVEWSRLAAHFSLTLRTFQRRFKLRTGMTPQQYLIDLRLRHARFLMQSDSRSLRDIAEYCHFYDASHLSGCLKQQGLTSTARVCRGSSLPTSPSRRR